MAHRHTFQWATETVRPRLSRPMMMQLTMHRLHSLRGRAASRLMIAAFCVTLPALAPANAVSQSSASKDLRPASCVADARFAITTIERNYAGFADKVTPRTQVAYDSATKRLMARAATASAADSPTDRTAACYRALGSWASFFRDGHLGVQPSDGVLASTSAPAALDTSPTAIRARFANSPTHPVTEAQVQRFLATNAGHLDPVEGIWEVIGLPYRLAVVPDSAGGVGSFLAVVLRADSAWRSPGQVKAALRADEANLGTMPGTSDSTVDANGSRYSVRYHYRDHTEQMTTARVTHGLLLFPDGSAWVRLAPHLATDADYATYAASLNRHTGVRSLDSQTVLLSIPSFDPDSGAVVDSVVRANRNVILGTENLIIDVRGNGGGSDYVYAPVLPFIATGPIRDVNASIYATPENTKKFEALLTDERIPPKLHTQIEDLVAAMRAHPGQFIHQPDEVTRFDTIFPRPRHVAVLTDQGCGSTCEQFVLAVRQSHKVTLMGERTAGVLDYANLQTVTMPSGRFTLHYGTSRSQRLPADPVDPNGIAPQVRVPADELFPVEWARRYLEQLSR